MDLYEVLDQVVVLLQQRGRGTYPCGVCSYSNCVVSVPLLGINIFAGDKCLAYVREIPALSPFYLSDTCKRVVYRFSSLAQ